MNRPTFATPHGLSLIVAMMVVEGAWCVDCGHGTRMTSKHWARCLKCGERVPRLDTLTAGEREMYAVFVREAAA